MNRSIFYCLFLSKTGTTYHFLFNVIDHPWVENAPEQQAARIDLHLPCFEPARVELVKLSHYDKLTQEDHDALQTLSESFERLRDEAHTMLREYTTGASGTLGKDEQLGQMIFGMDLEDWDSFC